MDYNLRSAKLGAEQIYEKISSIFKKDYEL